MSSRELVIAILERDAIGIENAFNRSIAEKIAGRLEIMHDDITHNMFNDELDEAKKKLKKMCEDINELSEVDLEEAKKKYKKMCEELSEEDIAQIDEKKWIAAAIKHPGALHKQLHVAADKKIPMGKLEAASHKGGTLARRANLAMTLRKLSKK